MSSPLRACRYYRVSTEEQDDGLQRHEVEALIERRNWTKAAVYAEKKSTRYVRKRLYQLMADARSGKFDVVVTWALDRFGRTALEVLGNIEELDRLGVKFVSVRESLIDTTSPSGRLVLGVMAHVAEFERARIRERTIAGLARARREGKQLGRPERALDEEHLRELVAKNLSLRDIARRLRWRDGEGRHHVGVSPATVSRRLGTAFRKRAATPNRRRAG
jgi:putative DNA-invertase from lambdoid prophage Rac